MPTPDFDITYRMQPADFRAMMDSRWRLTATTRIWVLLLKALCLSMGTFMGYLYWRDRDWIDGAIAAFFLASPITAPLINNWAYDRAFRHQRLGTADARIAVDAENINVYGPVGDTRFPWMSVQKVDVTPAHIFLWVHQHQAVILPVAAFGTTQRADDFAIFAKTHACGPAL
jgi:YcxB-like protein